MFASLGPDAILAERHYLFLDGQAVGMVESPEGVPGFQVVVRGFGLPEASLQGQDIICDSGGGWGSAGRPVAVDATLPGEHASLPRGTVDAPLSSRTVQAPLPSGTVQAPLHGGH